MRRPVDAPLGDGTAEHALRGVGPAQDYPCPIGTPVRAPFAAKRVIRWGDNDADGGFALSGYADNGDFWVLQHLSEYRNSRTAEEGEVVALSGNTGAWTYGPHLHHWVSIGGTRYNPEDIALYAATAGDNSTPFDPQEDTMTDDDFNRIRQIVQEEIAGPAIGIAEVRGVLDTVHDLIANPEYGIGIRVKRLNDYARLKVDAIWRWAQGIRVGEPADDNATDSALRRTMEGK